MNVPDPFSPFFTEKAHQGDWAYRWSMSACVAYKRGTCSVTGQEFQKGQLIVRRRNGWAIPCQEEVDAVFAEHRVIDRKYDPKINQVREPHGLLL